MATITLSIRYEKNTGLVYNQSELKNLYFAGIDLQDQYGNPIPEETINFYIAAAQKEVQDQLQIKLTRQAIYEQKDFVYEDYGKWSYIGVNYPCVLPISLQGFLNSILQLDYPRQYLSAKQGSDPDLYWRSINLVAISGPSVTLTGSAIFLGITPYAGLFGSRQIPNYWSVKYMTGFLKVPADILNYIGKIATINLFTVLQDVVLGVGVASKSLSVDGLSESLSTTASAMYGLFSARINQYQKDIDRAEPLLKGRYSEITMGVL